MKGIPLIAILCCTLKQLISHREREILDWVLGTFIPKNMLEVHNKRLEKLMKTILCHAIFETNFSEHQNPDEVI